MNEMKKDIYYIIYIKDKYIERLNLTTIKKRCCGKFIKQSYGNLYFELNGSKALIIIPEEWIECVAPSRELWHIKEDF